MERLEVVPDVIDEAPPDMLWIIYEGERKVRMGNELTPTQVQNLPQVTWRADPGKLYTLLMTDPDAPSRDTPTYREIRHWLVINIPGGNVLDGQILVDYRGAGPPKDTGLHRYVFLVFEQRQFIESTMYIPSTTREGRKNTSTRKLMEDFDLLNPVAGNFFQAQYDEYVAWRNAQEL